VGDRPHIDRCYEGKGLYPVTETYRPLCFDCIVNFSGSSVGNMSVWYNIDWCMCE